MSLRPHLHFIGIGGIVTSALAVALRKRGIPITGSDEYVLSPADKVLADAGISVADGFAEGQIPDRTDCVVVGSMIERGNPVLEEALLRRLKVVSWPRILSDLGMLKGRNAVIAGTDGKTTTSCMLSWILEQTGRKADHVIGGRLPGWETGVKLEGHEFCVLEGDEYRAGLGDRNPKFVYYHPEVVILTNIHFDHPEIFSSEEEVLRCYRLLAELMPSDGLVVYPVSDPRCVEIAHACNCRTAGYGTEGPADVLIQNFASNEHSSTFEMLGVTFELPVLGKMNVHNAAAAVLAAQHWGVLPAESAAALRTFPGAEGRQEVYRKDEGLVLISDTVYHPYATGCLLEAMQQHYPNRPLGLVLQPRHTFGSGNWQQELWPDNLGRVSKLLILPALNNATEKNSFSVDKLAEDMLRRGVHTNVASDAEHAISWFEELAKPGDVWVLCLQKWFKEPLTSILKYGTELGFAEAVAPEGTVPEE